jgi:hypothetical protein
MEILNSDEKQQLFEKNGSWFDQELYPYMNLNYASTLILTGRSLEERSRPEMFNTATGYVRDSLYDKLLSRNAERVEEAISELLPILYTAAFMNPGRFFKSLFSSALYSQQSYDYPPMNLEDKGMGRIFRHPIDTDQESKALRKRIYEELQQKLPMDLGREQERSWARDFDNFDEEIMFFRQLDDLQTYWDCQGFI